MIPHSWVWEGGGWGAGGRPEQDLPEPGRHPEAVTLDGLYQHKGPVEYMGGSMNRKEGAGEDDGVQGAG